MMQILHWHILRWRMLTLLCSKMEEAERHAQEAIKLDPNLGEPHATIGFVRMFWEWKLPEAKESLRKAVELSPDYATAHQWYSISLIITNVGGASLAEMKRAAELEPKSLAINADLCQVLYFLRKYDDALAQCNKTLEMDANFLNAHIYLYEIYTAKEMYNEAVEKFFKIEQLKSDFSYRLLIWKNSAQLSNKAESMLFGKPELSI